MKIKPKKYARHFEQILRPKMVKVDQCGDTNVFRISTPYYFDNGDQIRIYLHHNEEHGWHLTDEGWTLWELNSGWADNYFERENETLINYLCNMHNVIYQEAYRDASHSYHSALLIKKCPDIIKTITPNLFNNPLADYITTVTSLIHQARHMRWQERGIV